MCEGVSPTYRTQSTALTVLMPHEVPPSPVQALHPNFYDFLLTTRCSCCSWLWLWLGLYLRPCLWICSALSLTVPQCGWLRAWIALVAYVWRFNILLRDFYFHIFYVDFATCLGEAEEESGGGAVLRCALARLREESQVTNQIRSIVCFVVSRRRSSDVLLRLGLWAVYLPRPSWGRAWPRTA